MTKCRRWILVLLKLRGKCLSHVLLCKGYRALFYSGQKRVQHAATEENTYKQKKTSANSENIFISLKHLLQILTMQTNIEMCCK